VARASRHSIRERLRLQIEIGGVATSHKALVGRFMLSAEYFTTNRVVGYKYRRQSYG